jgi:4-amino-4-deoxy-L-arabinose transferase-like glycosyltransferase
VNRERRFWFLEVQVVGLIMLVLGIHATRLSALAIRGEESRWGRIACEMRQTGDWVVPRLQGQPFLSRPPLGSWLIALSSLVRGDCDLVAVRLPSVLATLLMTLLLYGYARTFLPRLAALAAATAYATMAQVMELGRLAETEAVFTFFVSASLLVWHWGYTRRWPTAWTWTAAYGLAALATLTKGPQAPVYFVAVVGLYLMAHNWRYLVSWSHVLGIGVFLGVVGAWQIPFYRALGWEGVRQIWSGDTALRFLILEPAFVTKHLLTYPLEILCCTLPASPLLALYLSRTFRQTLGNARGPVGFLTLALAVTFPTCWFVPGAQSRYFMPLYPVVALLAGLAVQRCLEAEVGSPLHWAWRWQWTFLAPTLGVVALSVAGTSFFTSVAMLASPWTWVVVLMAGAVAVLAWRARNGVSPAGGQVLVLGGAAWLGLIYTGLVIPFVARKSEDAAPAVARLKEQLPRSQRLVSFGPVSHLFAYLYRDPIPLVSGPAQMDRLEGGTDYFCFDRLADEPVNLPFAWEEVAAITCDRYRTPIPQHKVVVGRRVSDHRLRVSN